MATQPNVVFIRCDNVGWGDVVVYRGGAATPRLTRATLSRRSIRSL